MLDIKFIRQNHEKVKEAIKNKNVDLDLDKLLASDERRRHLLSESESLKAEQNKRSKGPQSPVDLEELRALKEKIKLIENELKSVEEEFERLMMMVPNIPSEDTPVGKDESGNKILRKWGKIKNFDFKPKEHWELGVELDLIDTERAAKVSGSRFGYLKGKLVLLEFAIVQFVLERLIKKGYVPILPPALIKLGITKHLGYWDSGGNENYYLVSDFQKDKPKTEEVSNLLYLVGTAEHSIVPMYQNETIHKEELPKKFIGFSSSFRREAGSYGRDTKGILRVHQFDKLEMICFVKPEEDKIIRQEMVELVEKMLQELKLSYQVVQLCTGDISFPAAATTDIETWMPGQGKYRETHSISTTTDFQSRRLKTKYTDNNENKLVYILNGTAFALGRIMIAIMENYQTKKGTIEVPKVLRKYMGGIKEIK